VHYSQHVRILGVPIDPPQEVLARIVSDLGAVARIARSAPGQLERLLALGDEITAIGRNVMELGERLDARAEVIAVLGERLDARAEAFAMLGERLDTRAAELLELGAGISELGNRIDARGAEMVQRAGQVVETGNDLVQALPTLERALELATPLEGAIARAGRFVDRLPGGANVRRPGPRDPVR
jgi:uncharacterized protein (DUF3084 family)